MLFRSTIAAAAGAALLSFAAATEQPVCKVVTVVEHGQPTWVPNKSPKAYPTSGGPIKGSYEPYPTKGSDDYYPTKGSDDEDAYPTTSGSEDSYPTTTTTITVYPTISKGSGGWNNWNSSTTFSTATYSNTQSTSGSGEYSTTEYATPTTSDATTSDSTTTTSSTSDTTTTSGSTTDATSTTTTTTAVSSATTTTATTTTTTTTTATTTTTTPTSQRNCPDPTATFVIKATNNADVENKYAVLVDAAANDRRLEFSADAADTAAFFSFTEACQVVTAAGQAFVVTDNDVGEFADPHFQNVLVPGDETGDLFFTVNECSTTDLGGNQLQLSCTASNGGPVQDTFSIDQGQLLISTASNSFGRVTVVLEQIVTQPPRRRQARA